MRTFVCAALVLIASAGICVRAESDAATKIAQADSNAPAAAPAPAQSGAAEQKLVGLAAWNKLVGNSISGTEDGQALIETSYIVAVSPATSSLHSGLSSSGYLKPDHLADEHPIPRRNLTAQHRFCRAVGRIITQITSVNQYLPRLMRGR